MNVISLLEKLWIAIQLTLYSAFGLAPILGGIYTIYISQTEYFAKDYLATMYLSMGVVSLLIGFLVSWACFVKIVQVYRDYISQKDR